MAPRLNVPLTPAQTPQKPKPAKPTSATTDADTKDAKSTDAQIVDIYTPVAEKMGLPQVDCSADWELPTLSPEDLVGPSTGITSQVPSKTHCKKRDLTQEQAARELKGNSELSRYVHAFYGYTAKYMEAIKSRADENWRGAALIDCAAIADIDEFIASNDCNFGAANFRESLFQRTTSMWKSRKNRIMKRRTLRTMRRNFVDRLDFPRFLNVLLVLWDECREWRSTESSDGMASCAHGMALS
ncbi:uncharacterized protein N7496_001672 [Penicillium cataractarum]|uniref:Uncharacterized protein n=1 Tax=Penicillium cataractarum TaxID=2100454 RepID=A0A9X0B741_9EURO|nr:uncharacterized protein N7496_001672 [Penicillium cataractarum]KAJ5390604.1 hypothetical protein N7496_001672 [Penicillium cataractarum]